MEKEGLGNLFNSRDGKVNILLFFLIISIVEILLDINSKNTRSLFCLKRNKFKNESLPHNHKGVEY